MGEDFFTPRSLARVANAVEWEDVLVEYKDGSTNFSCYTQAMAILWERWMREFTLDDFREAVTNVRGGNFVQEFQRMCEALPGRIAVLRGFWEGLWYGANPGRKPPPRGRWMPALPSYSAEEHAMVIIDKLLRDLAQIVTDE